MSQKQLREFSAFLRAKRSSVSPEHWGLSTQGVRRTPGLRREEVALLSKVSTTWYTWLEQGRDIRPSQEALNSIAKVLLLTPPEIQYLQQLAGVKRTQPSMATLGELPPGLLAMMNKLGMPAILLSEKIDILHYNAAWSEKVLDFCDYPDHSSNWAKFVFCEPVARQKLVNPDVHMIRFVGEVRDYLGKSVDQPWAIELLDYLKVNSPNFAQLWTSFNVSDRTSLTFDVFGNDGKIISFERNVMLPIQCPTYRLMIFNPL